MSAVAKIAGLNLALPKPDINPASLLAAAQGCVGGNKPGKLPAKSTWGDSRKLEDHYKRHGSDFKSKSPDQYAQQASKFLQDSQKNGSPTKIDRDGTIRVFDPKTNTFGAYNPDGTTKTFFKPSNPNYWNNQPGSSPWIP